MSDNDGKKPLGLRGGPRSGNVKQSFSHGRTKSVVVETKRKRVVVPKPGAAGAAGPKPSGAKPSRGAESKRPAGISDAEMERRMKALQAAKIREVEEAKNREAQEKARAEERERRRAEQEAKEREQREVEEASKRKADEEERAKREAEEAATRKAADAAAAKAAPAPKAEVQREAPRGGGKPAPAATPRKKERDDANRNNRNKGRDDGRRSGRPGIRLLCLSASDPAAEPGLGGISGQSPSLVRRRPVQQPRRRRQRVSGRPALRKGRRHRSG